MEHETFWARVKPLIKAHKLTQEQFAEYLKIPAGTFRGWIYQDRIPDTATAYNIAIALGVTLDYLLGGRQQDIADRRLKELAARNAVTRIAELVAQIQEEVSHLPPLHKGKLR